MIVSIRNLNYSGGYEWKISRSKGRTTVKINWGVAAFLVLITAVCQAETASLLILHTNDIHDHVRADYDGVGGMAYVSGYIQSVRKDRSDVLVLDAGDVMEKGDLVAYLDKSDLTYRTMAAAGYDVVVPGNHDDAYGLEHLQQLSSLMSKTKFVAANITDADTKPIYPASTIVTVNGVRIGIIGIARPNDALREKEVDLARRVRKEANALKDQTDLLVVLTHNGSRACRTFSAMAPDVDIFVSGHSHEIIKTPIVVDRTGALIVQAGDYANYVGRLELTIDLDKKEITKHSGSLVKMDHAVIPENISVTALVNAVESKLCPEARSVISRCNEKVNFRDVGLLAAASLYSASEADIAFCHPSQIIRDTFPIGDVDVNAVFRTGGQRGSTIVRAQLDGRVIKQYVDGLANTEWGQTISFGAESNNIHELADEEVYEVVMPQKEWDTRFLRVMNRIHSEEKTDLTYEYKVEPCTFTDAVVAFLTSPSNQELAIEDIIANVPKTSGSKLRIVW